MEMLAVSNQVQTQANLTRTKVLVFIFCFLSLLADGADLMFLSYSLSSLRQEFGLSSFEAGSLGSITLAGMAIGGIYGGWASDRFGRVKVLFWATILFSIFTAGLGFTHSYWQFAVVRFISALGLGSVFVACNTLMSEYVSTKYRTTVLGTLQAGWTVGYVVATLVAGAIIPEHGWRWMFFLAIVPVVVALLIKPYVPEPPAWLAAQAERLRNKKNVTGAAVPQKAGSLRTIFADKITRRMFVLWTLTGGLLQFGYYGVNNWLPSYLERELSMDFKSMTGYMLGTYAAMIIGKIGAGFAADWMGRRKTYVTGCLATALLIPIIVYFNSPENILFLLVFFGFVYGTSMGVVATYMTESFPTPIRGAAIGGAYNFGRIGAAFAPAIIGLMAAQVSIAAGMLVMALAYMLTALIPALYIRDKIYDPQKA